MNDNTINKKELEDFLIESKFARYNPGFVFVLCKKFNLSSQRIREGWLEGEAIITRGGQ